MPHDNEQIRSLVERWAAAVHTGDLNGVMASFEIVSLDITAGDDVAYAHALLRCGTPQELVAQPENRLRLTLGLRKEQDRWVVAHEHHSFPDATSGDVQPTG
ncbi:nuclear transport factor 2 family protein [Streptomyces sp. NPDC051219]|uniref:YybH family protein n=1 Tax=Streptomyces sp. NPDC051219 TaxID=3155283 RepID=UPI00342F8897